MKTIMPKGGDMPRPIGKYGSVSEAARRLGITRQEVKRLLAPKESKPAGFLCGDARRMICANTGGRHDLFHDQGRHRKTATQAEQSGQCPDAVCDIAGHQ